MSETFDSPPTFEDSLVELQQIVRELEDGTLGLEPSLARFEQGIRMLRRCYEILDRAEQKIEILTGIDAAGNPMTAPFDATATMDAVERPVRKTTRRRSTTPAAEQIPAEQPTPPETGESLF